MTIPTRTIDNVMVSSFKAHLSSLINMLLLVKAIAPKGTLVIISRVVTLVVQILESMKTRYTSYSNLSRRVRLRIDLIEPNSQFVVFYFVRTITFLTFSILSLCQAWFIPGDKVYEVYLEVCRVCKLYA